MINRPIQKFNINWFGFLAILILSLIVAKVFITYSIAPLVFLFLAFFAIAIFFVKPIYFLFAYSVFFWVQYSLGARFLAGLTVPEATAYIGFLFYIIAGIVKGKDLARDFIGVPFFAPLAIFLICGFYVYLFGSVTDKETAFILYRQSSVYTLIVYILFIKTIKSVDEARKIILGLVIGGLTIGALAYSAHRGYSGVEFTSYERLGGEYSIAGINFWFHPIGIGTYLSSILPLALTLWLMGNGKITKLVCFISLVCVSFFLILTGTRAAWMAAAASMFIVILLSYRYGGVKTYKIVLIPALLILILVGIFTYEAVGINVLEKRVDTFKTGEAVDSLDTRIELWQGGLRHLLERPLGIGYSDKYPYCYMTTPHNFYIALGLGSGIFGFIAFAWFIIGCFRMVFAELKRSSSDENLIYISAIGSLVTLLINGMFDVPIYYGSIALTLIFIVLSCAVTVANRKNESVLQS